MSLSRETSGCWICHRHLDQLGDVERISDPRTGEWAHKTCCDKTTAGAIWRLRLSATELRDVTWVHIQNDAERVGRRLLPLVPLRVRNWIKDHG
jgi:hypothetical protein